MNDHFKGALDIYQLKRTKLSLATAMMYSQQEYDTMRRQTLQIEAEKRALLRSLLIVISALLTISLILLGYIFYRYSRSKSLINAAEAKAALMETQYQQCSQELQEKRAQLEVRAKRNVQRNNLINVVIPKMISNIAETYELAQLAHAIYESPGHVIELPAIPPDSILRRYRYRAEGHIYSYILVAGNVDGKWRLYSNLVSKSRQE